MGVFIFCVVASLLILNYRINKLEQETKDLKILQKINSRNLEYLCYLAPEPKEGQLTYDEYMNKCYKLEQEIKDLKILQKINSRNIEYLCYLAPEPKEGQLTYDEYMKKQGYMKGEEDGRSNN